MHRQQNHTRECVHVITDLAHVGDTHTKKSDGKKREKERARESKTSTSEIMYIKKTQQEERFKKQTWGV